MEQMQEMLHSKGLGKAVEAALAAAGLTSFCRGRDVFERLYRDALRRMRVYAENQTLGDVSSVQHQFGLDGLGIMFVMPQCQAHFNREWQRFIARHIDREVKSRGSGFLMFSQIFTRKSFQWCTSLRAFKATQLAKPHASNEGDQNSARWLGSNI